MTAHAPRHAPTRWRRCAAALLAAIVLGLVTAARPVRAAPSEGACAPRIDLAQTGARASECFVETANDPRGAAMTARTNATSIVRLAAHAPFAHLEKVVAGASMLLALTMLGVLRAAMGRRRSIPPPSTRRRAAAFAPIDLAPDDADAIVARRPSRPEAALARIAGLDALVATIERLRDASTDFVVALVDVDHLERLNDLFGRATGDRCVEIVAATIGPAELVFRRGGGELAWILPRTEIDHAAVRANALRDDVASTSRRAGIHFTVSIGLARSSSADASGDVLRAAMLALRRAKRRGRDRIDATASEGISGVAASW
jgi:diguanylate cyclase (GGDEF)-like protein